MTDKAYFFPSLNTMLLNFLNTFDIPEQMAHCLLFKKIYLENLHMFTQYP